MISLRCTVVRADRPWEVCDVAVDAPAGATARDLVTALGQSDVLQAPERLSVGGVAVPDTAVLGRRPLVAGALLVSGGAWRDEPGPPRTLLELHVASGPDAGSILPLRPGALTVGRDAASMLPVADVHLSRTHFSLTLDNHGLHLHDLGSSNGTTVNGTAVSAEGAPCPPGSRIEAGSSTFVVRSPSGRPISSATTERGTIAITRGPRASAPSDPVTFRRTAPPTPADRTNLPWLAMLVPVMLCLPLAWLMHQPTYLLFGLMSPLTMALSHLTERRGRRRRNRDQHAVWEAADQRTSRLIEQALAAELVQRRIDAADPALLLDAARLPGHRLWEREPEAADLLHLAVGVGDIPATVTVMSDDGASHPTLTGAPVVIDLADVGHLGVSGRPDVVSGVLRLAVARLAVQCSPRGVRLVVLGERLDWTRWLPHRTDVSLAQLAREVRRRLEVSAATAPPSARLVVVVDDVTPWSCDPSFAVVLDDGPRVGVHVLVGADRPERLPSRCGAVLAADERDSSALTYGDGRRVELAVDAVGATWAEEVARALAPLEDATPQPGSLPGQVDLADVCGLDPLSPEEVATAWRRSARSPRFAIGAGAAGPVHVDLVRDGPHALVAGTTGAGKSELLQTIVCSLALGNRPDELAFVLVDYKGGAAFRDLADLPHVVGLVTDLDAHLAERALASLQAELTRRERLLADAGASDVDEYVARRDAGVAEQPLARLVLVVDEFRLLADELPTFLDGLVRLASIGRSLGVHLVLATQRPAGVVSADIKANVNLRICLRVRDRAESEDVVDAPDAAALPVDVPGRAVMRTGSETLLPFQVALASGQSPATPSPTAPTSAPTVRVRRTSPGEAASGGPAPGIGAAAPLPLVRAISEAAAICGAAAPPSPWLPPLPDCVLPEDLGSVAGASPVAPYGLIDRPEQGRRELLGWDAAASSHLAVSGMARSGRSSSCLALALAASERHGPDELHVHVIEAAARVGPALAGLPHLGTHALAAQPQVVARLVQRLSREAPRSSHTLLVVDGWEAVAEALDALDHGQTTDELVALLRDGERWGLRAVVTGGRGVLTGRVSGVLPERLVLRTADPTDLLLAGAARPAPLVHQPPGRALHLPSGHEVQLVWPGDHADVVRRVEALRARYAEGGATSPAPLSVRSLPRRAWLSRAGGRADAIVEVGVGGDDVEPLHLDLAGAPVVAVAGPAGSGRSSTLVSWAAQLHTRGVGVLAVADAGSLLAHGPWPVRDPLRDADWPDGARYLLVDDADRLPDPVVQRLAAWTAGGQPRRSLVVAAASDALTSSFTGLAAAVRRHRTGILLQPERPLDGDAFGVVAERPDVRTPGRGLLVVRGRATPVQVALPHEEPNAEQ